MRNSTLFCSATQTSFQIENLSATIDIGALPTSPASGTRPYTFTTSGIFKLTSVTYIQGTATFSTSSGKTPTVIEVAIVATSQIKAADLINALIAPTTNAGTTVQAWDTVPVPVDYTKPDYILQAGLQLDLTNHTFLAYGAFVLPGGGTKAEMYGAVALLVMPATGTSTTYQYIIAAALKNWTFAQISESLAVIDTILTVKEAAILLSTSDTPDTTLLSTYVPAIGTSLTSKRGLNFYATLQFGIGTGLLTQVAQLLGITTQKTFAIKGYIASESTHSEFEASLGDLTLLGFLSFKNIVLKYQVQQATSFTLTGDIVVQVDKPYTFHGDVTVVRTTANNLTTTQANAHIATTQAITKPLGIPALSLNSLFFDFYYIFGGTASDTQYIVGGDVSFSDVISLKGSIFFKNHSPAVVFIKLDNLDIGVFFSKIFGSTWSSDLLSFRLKNGMLYYAPQAVSLSLYDRSQNSVSTIDFLSGFHAAADIDIFFIKDFHIDVTVNHDGIVATGSYLSPINWGFIQFYRGPVMGTNHVLVPADPTKGPLVSINSTTSTFTLSGGLGLFGTSIASLLMNVKANHASGHITLDQDLPPFGRPAFDFVWDDNGFRVTDWALGAIKLPDFDFTNLMLDGNCPASGILQIPIRSKVSITPSFSITMITSAGQAVATPMLQITINGSLDLVVDSSAYPDALLTAHIVNAELDVPLPTTEAFTWSKLADSFVKCITSAAASIFDNLVKDPQNLAKLLAVEGVVWGIDAVKDFLTCEGVDAAAAELFAEGATSATTVTITASILGTTGIVVGGIIGTIDEHGNHHNGDGGHDSSKPRPAAPSAPTLSYGNGQLTVSWASVSNASQYAAIIKQDGQKFKQTNASPALSVPVDAEDGHIYTAQIVAAGEGGTSDPGAGASLTVLGHVKITGIRYENGQIIATWRDPIHGATHYVGQLVNATHTPVSQTAAATIPYKDDTLSLSINVPAGIASGNIYMSIQATTNLANPVAGNVAYSPDSVQYLATPAITGLEVKDQQIVITLQTNVSQATNYNVQFLNGANNTPVGDIFIVPVASDAAIRFPAPPLPANLYKVQVQAIGTPQTTIPSNWFISPTAITLLDAPTISAVNYAKNQVTVAWSVITGATSYAVELYKETTRVATGGTQQSGMTPPATQTSVAITTLPKGVTYMARVNAGMSGGISAWSQSLAILVLDPPTGLRLSFVSPHVIANWDSVSYADSYNFVLRDTDGGPLIPVQPDIKALSYSLNVSQVPDGNYWGHVQTNAQGQMSLWSDAVPIQVTQLPPAPVIRRMNAVGSQGQQPFDDTEAALALNSPITQINRHYR